MPAVAPFTAASRSASASTTFGLFPPSSRVQRFTCSAHSFPTHLPISVEPVKATLSTPGWRMRAAPATEPEPVTTENTPAGSPHSTAISATLRMLMGVMEAGFKTMQQPAASAGATFQTARSRGKFQGVTAPTTPTGSRRV